MATAEALITENIDLWTAAVKRKSSAGRGAGKKIELYGIKKLRELILEMAMRGLLVPQDPADEPAGVLLERIAAEKVRLVAEEKLKTRASDLIDDKDLFISTPKSWSWLRLGNIAKFIDYRGKTPKKIDAGVRLITAKNVRFGYIDKEPEEFVSEEEYNSWMTRGFPKVGDLLFTPEAPLGNIAEIETQGKFALAQRAICFQPHVAGVGKYLKLFIMSPSFQLQLLENATGMTAKGIKASKLKEIPVVIPPLAEQHRIVAKVDELMALCDQLEQQTEANISAHQTLVETLLTAVTGNDANSAESIALLFANFDSLFTTENSVDQLKQTILQLAVMGKLVPQDPNDEPASVLLEKIAAEKEKLVKEKKIKKQKALPPIEDAEKPFELPVGWEWCRFGSVSSTRLGKMLDKAKNKGNELPYLRNTNVQWHRFNLEDVKLMRIETEEKKELRLIKGDLLICEGGEPGRCAIWSDEDTEMYFQKALHRARPFGSISAEYLKICLTVDASNGGLDKYFTGATIKHFVGAKLNSYVIPLPPLEQQHRIVAKVDELMTLCDQLKTRLNTAQTTQLHLADTVTEQAIV